MRAVVSRTRPALGRGRPEMANAYDTAVVRLSVAYSNGPIEGVNRKKSGVMARTPATDHPDIDARKSVGIFPIPWSPKG